ncbi:MAG: hypothetical protein NTV05_15675 [Acidobacteria bacterium]|nr:hypothetical protein [Acidobacteriota bacterium]
MTDQHMYLIPKAPRQVTLWVHPEGRVVGYIFLSFQTHKGTGVEGLSDVLNSADPFLVLQRTDREGHGFYNKGAIVRVEYEEDDLPAYEGSKTLDCRVSMMDGLIVEGKVRYVLPPNRARLYDYLNLREESFIALYLEDRRICLLNKTHVACVSYLGDERAEESPSGTVFPA